MQTNTTKVNKKLNIVEKLQYSIGGLKDYRTRPTSPHPFPRSGSLRRGIPAGLNLGTWFLHGPKFPAGPTISYGAAVCRHKWTMPSRHLL